MADAPDLSSAERPRPAGTRRRDVKAELLLALMPTAVTLGVLALVETYSHQRLLFASLASSAFLIYLDPKHVTNSVRTLLIAQGSAVVIGLGVATFLAHGYAGAAVSMVAAIFVMLTFDAMHPPAVSTAVSFSFANSPPRAGVLFAVSLGLIAVLVILQRLSIWLAGRLREQT